MVKRRQPLNDQQRKLVEDNMRLVTFVFSKYLPNSIGDLDAHQNGYMGLCEAAQAFDPKKGFKFSTLAVKCIVMAVYKKGRSRKSEIPQWAIADNVRMGEEGELSIFDITPDPNAAFEDDATLKVVLDQIDFSERQRYVIRQLIEERNQPEMCREIGISQTQISRDIKSVRALVRQAM